jgi:flagellar biosynthesis protein FlhF
MNIQRFAARTSHEAMARVRRAFGDDAVVLHTRPCAEGIELLAISSRDLSSLERLGDGAARHAFVAPVPAPRADTAGAMAREADRLMTPPASAQTSTRADVKGDVDLLSMTTLSFQDYVRQRMRQRRREAGDAKAAATSAEGSDPMRPRSEAGAGFDLPPTTARAPVTGRGAETEPRRRVATAQGIEVRAVAPIEPAMETRPGIVAAEPDAVAPSRQTAMPTVSAVASATAVAAAPSTMPAPPATGAATMARAGAPAVQATPETAVTASAVPTARSHDVAPAMPVTQAETVESVAAAPDEPAAPTATVTPDAALLLSELRSLKSLIEERLGTWVVAENLRDPRRAQLAQRLFDAGFSAGLVRTLAVRLPESVSDEAAWAELELERYLVTPPQGASLEDAKGVFALVGPAGSGKTGCIVKIAASFVARHGAGQLGLVTLDAQRAGGHEGLRAYGRAMGVAVHVAHDRASLQGLMQLLAAKRLLLIDTPGVSARDGAAAELLDTLGEASVRRILVVAAPSQGEAIEDAVRSFGGQGLQGAVLARADEALRLGPALDVLIRHRLRLWGVAQGPSLAQDWHRADARRLLQRALRAQVPAAWRADASQVVMLMAAAGPAPAGAA